MSVINYYFMGAEQEPNGMPTLLAVLAVACIITLAGLAMVG